MSLVTISTGRTGRKEKPWHAIRRRLSAELRIRIAGALVGDVATVEVDPMAAFGMWAERNQYNLDDADERAAAIAEYGK